MASMQRQCSACLGRFSLCVGRKDMGFRANQKYAGCRVGRRLLRRSTYEAMGVSI